MHTTPTQVAMYMSIHSHTKNKNIMQWNEFEKKVFEELSNYYIGEKIVFDHAIKGRYSNRSRQIDIYIEEDIGGKKVITVVDCKFYNKDVDIKSVESFISMADDIGADIALMITEKGYSKSALKRAFNNPKNIELDILNFKELKHNLQGDLAIPYSGRNAALVRAPFGWIVDAKRTEYALCFLFERGLDLNSAMKEGEFAYINFWNNLKDKYSVKQFSEIQKKVLEQEFSIESNTYFSTFNELGKDSGIRVTKKENEPLIEIAGYIRFDDFIFFCICNCKESMSKRNTTKIRLLLKYVLPIIVNDEQGSNQEKSNLFQRISDWFTQIFRK